MLTARIDVADLAATRFAVSPLAETISAVHVIAHPARSAINLPWFRWAQRQLAEHSLELPMVWPLVVSDRHGWPEFLAPAPARRWTDVSEQLARLRETTAEQIATSLHRCFGTAIPESAAELMRHPRAGLAELAAELRRAYDLLVAPHWDRLSGVFDADIGYRAGLLAEGGARRLFNSLHQDLRWEAGCLTLSSARRRCEVALGPDGLVLIPTVFGWPRAMMRTRTSTQTTLRYPARGVGALWETSRRVRSESAVERLLGVPRARLLGCLRTPATTTSLARALGVTPSAVSQHLAVLRESGLVSRQRAGRSVLYVVSELGLALLGEQD